jgi:FAS-associated factor 2
LYQIHLHTSLWTCISCDDCHLQDLTGIEDISVCRDVLQRHAWDLEVSVQDQLNMREGRPSVFASDIRTPAVVNDHSTQHVFFSPPRDSSPHSIRGLFRYVVSLVLQLCYNTITSILQFTFRLFQPDPRRCEYCLIIVYFWKLR